MGTPGQRVVCRNAKEQSPGYVAKSVPSTEEKSHSTPEALSRAPES